MQNKDLIITKKETKKVLLVGVNTNNGRDFDRLMDELKSLAVADGLEVKGIVTQNLAEVNKGTYIGEGKLEECKNAIKMLEIDEVIFDNELTPAQQSNLCSILDTVVYDRTGLILEIFSDRARTKEAKLQVEMAKLKYMLPRLKGLHKNLSRQGGTSGSLSNKGSGEKQIELDRRVIVKRIADIRRDLEKVALNRQVQRKKRDASSIKRVSMVGYTNAGKSTVMNSLLDLLEQDEEKKVFEKDMLFATLDTNVRKIDAGDKKPFFLADTVGFIDELPHELVKAFHSTLEEVCEADLLLHVVDFSDPNFKEHIKITENTLNQIGAGGIKTLMVYNKVDRTNLLDAEPSMTEKFDYPKVVNDSIYISAKDEASVKRLLSFVEDNIYSFREKCTFLIPYKNGNVVSYFCDNAEVISNEYVEEGVKLVVNCLKQDKIKYSEFLIQ